MADEVEKEVTEETETEGQILKSRSSRTGEGPPEDEAGRASRTISDSDEDVEGQSYLRTRTT